MNSDNRMIKFNLDMHNKKYNQYDKYQEDKIFSPHEQERLYNCLAFAVNNIISTRPRDKLTALDYGCGTGNLTNHLISLGLNVTAADISEKFLETIEYRFAHTNKCKTYTLGLKGLKVFDDNTFEVVACYSVLHHIPDYLRAVIEMTRIIKPGGIIYIDHEVNDSYWNPSEDCIRFKQLSMTLNKSKKIWYRWLQISHYKNEMYLRLRKSGIFKNTSITNPLNPRYQPYGDIHVWPDDHIEWKKIEDVLIKNGTMLLHKEDYLLYKADYPENLYEEYKNKCSDHRVLIARKL